MSTLLIDAPLSACRKAPRGFTLIELLCVLSVLAILATLILPSLAPALRGTSLTQASSNVVGVFAFARQAALSQNQAMEVRLYQYADSSISGETANNPATGRYRAIQVFAISDSGVATAVGKMERLPAGIIIDSNTTLSSILAQTAVKNPSFSLPGLGTSYYYQSFRLRPDGSTSLSATPPRPPGTWCLTLHSVTLGDGLSTPPPNFATVQIDPVAGKVVTFRP